MHGPKFTQVATLTALLLLAGGVIACSGATTSKSTTSDNGGLGQPAGAGASHASAGSAETATPPPAKAPGSFGEGTFQIGAEVKAGIYAAAVPNDSSGCYVEVSKDDSGSLNSVISNDNFNAGAHVLVQVATGQFLKTDGCGTFTPATKPAAPATSFTEGVFRGGFEIAAGSYTAAVPNDSTNCYVEVAKDGSGKIDSIVNNNNYNAAAHARVSVKAGQWLKTDGCGTWVKV
jgi:hypothetical protein